MLIINQSEKNANLERGILSKICRACNVINLNVERFHTKYINFVINVICLKYIFLFTYEYL